jgi:hypothetical protein
MAFADVLPHAAYELSLFLIDDEKRRLCLASRTVHEACTPYRNNFDTPLATSSQWRRCMRRLPRVASLRVYANALNDLSVVCMVHLVRLDLTSCGLVTAHIPRSLILALRQASALKHFTVSHNPLLKTSGFARLLRALAKANASLRTLNAVNTGINRLPLVDKPLLSQVEDLALTRNKLSTDTVRLIFQHLDLLENATFDIYHAEPRPILNHTKVNTLSWWRCSPQGIESLLSSSQIVCASLFCRFPSRWTWTPTVAIANNLKRLNIGSIHMPPEAWTAFFTAMATATTMAELRVWSTDTPHEALVAFIEHHRHPPALEALGIAYNEAFTEKHLVRLCEAMIDRRVVLKKWILKGCRRLRLVESAAYFVATLRREPVHLDLAAVQPINLNRKFEAQWFNHLFEHASFEYLDLSFRAVILEDDLLPEAFRHIQHLGLCNTEINWGLDVPMPHLRSLNLSSVGSRVYRCTDLLHQALEKPRMCSLNVDHCYLDEYRVLSRAKYLTSLSLDWVTDGHNFFGALAQAVARGDFPSLTTLSLVRADPHVVSSLVRAMQGGQRRCCIDARSKRWTSSDLETLFVSLDRLQPGDVSHLHIWIEDAAKQTFEDRKGSFPFIAFNVK